MKHYLSFYENNTPSFNIVDKNHDDAFEINLNHPDKDYRISLFEVGPNYNTNILWSKDIQNESEAKLYGLKIFSQLHEDTFDVLSSYLKMDKDVMDIPDIDFNYNPNNFYMFVLIYDNKQITSMILINAN